MRLTIEDFQLDEHRRGRSVVATDFDDAEAGQVRDRVAETARGVLTPGSQIVATSLHLDPPFGPAIEMGKTDLAELLAPHQLRRRAGAVVITEPVTTEAKS
jgi:hypothetical protein